MTKEEDLRSLADAVAEAIEGYKAGLVGGPMEFVSAEFDIGWTLGAQERATSGIDGAGAGERPVAWKSGDESWPDVILEMVRLYHDDPTDMRWTALGAAIRAAAHPPVPSDQRLREARAWIEGAWCAGYYDAGYTHDSAYAAEQAEKFADAALAGEPTPVPSDQRLREALTEIAGADPVDLMCDPQWAQRIASAALAGEPTPKEPG